MIKRSISSLNLHTLLLLTLLPGLLALVFTASNTYHRERSAADQALLARVRTMSQLVDQHLLSVQSSLELLAATSDELDQEQLQKFHRKLLSSKSNLTLVDSLALYTPDGQMILHSREPYGSKLPRSANFQRIQAVVASGKSSVGDIITGAISKQALIPVDVPVNRNGRVVFVLTAGIYCEHINTVLASQLFPEGWSSVIYDRSGTIAGRRFNANQFIGKKAAPIVLEWLEGPAERLGEGRTLENKFSVAAMHRSDTTGYSVIASVPEEILVAPLRQEVMSTVLALGGSMLLGLFLAWRFAQSLRASLRDLEQATQAVAAGQVQVALPSGGSVELVRLSGRFSTMLTALQDARAAQEKYQRELEHSATHDPLTGLANRLLVGDRLKQAISLAARNQLNVAVLLLDLDRFKVINDTLTHVTGDALLVEIAGRLKAQVREGDTVGRLGGDEFMVVMQGIASEEAAAMLANKLLSAISDPIQAHGHMLTVNASVGIALAPRDGQNTDDLIMHADVAMYRAKESGRNKFQFFAAEMNARMNQRLQLEAGLRLALEQGQFVLYYQPRCDLATGRIVGAEALIRWRHPERGLVSPADFIPVAEETGLIVPMGEWVLETACRQAMQWRSKGLDELVVGVNVSARQFQHGNLAQVVAKHLQATGLPPALLELELTESAVMNDPECTLQVLREIKAVGVRIALDDFGTGYSSLNYLKRFPVDCLKIDQSFVRDISIDPEDAAIARMVVTLGHSLRQVVVAEGVETHAQLDFLREQGCDLVQGYLFSPPVPANELEAMIRSGRRLIGA